MIQSGGLMSAKSNFVITVHGKGGHGAMPHLCIDPIVCAAAIIQSLQTIVSRNVDPMENAILTIGSIHGGSVENLIVEDVRMTGCVRALSQKTKEMQIRRLEEIVTNTAKAYQCTADIEYKEVLPVAYNTPEMTKIAHRAAAMDKIPSYLYWVGSGTAGEPLHAWHNPKFHANDTALPVAAAVYASSAVTANQL